MERGGSGFDRGHAYTSGNGRFDREDHPFHGGHPFVGGPFYSPWFDGGYYDSYCSPVSPYYDPPACWAYYDD